MLCPKQLNGEGVIRHDADGAILLVKIVDMQQNDDALWMQKNEAILQKHNTNMELWVNFCLDVRSTMHDACVSLGKLFACFPLYIILKSGSLLCIHHSRI